MNDWMNVPDLCIRICVCRLGFCHRNSGQTTRICPTTSCTPDLRYQKDRPKTSTTSLLQQLNLPSLSQRRGERRLKVLANTITTIHQFSLNTSLDQHITQHAATSTSISLPKPTPLTVDDRSSSEQRENGICCLTPVIYWAPNVSNITLLFENLLLTWNDKPIVAQRFLKSQLKRLALETCQLAGKHAGKLHSASDGEG